MRRTCRVAVLLLVAGCALALEHGTISTTTVTCQQQYQAILATYYDNSTVAPQDGAYNCSDVIQASFASQDGTGCYAYDIMIGCFQVAIQPWNNFVHSCNTIFSAAPNCASQGTAWADCSRPSYNTDSFVVGLNEGTSKFTVDSFSFDTGAIDNAGNGWQSAFYVGGDSDKRRRLQQISDNEGGGGGSGLDAGCFPDFYSYDDWTDWIQGSYQEPTFGGNQINPVCTIFWLLQAIGIFAMAFV